MGWEGVLVALSNGEGRVKETRISIRERFHTMHTKNELGFLHAQKVKDDISIWNLRIHQVFWKPHLQNYWYAKSYL